jgi:hypothetical protein
MPGNVTGEFNMSCNWATAKACQNCAFAHGDSPFENAPNKANCEVYTRENGINKPNAILFDGAPCKYFEEDD